MFSFEIELDGKPERFRLATIQFAAKHGWGKEHASPLMVEGRKCILQRYEGSRAGKQCDDTVFALAACCEEYVEEELAEAPLSWHYRTLGSWYNTILHNLGIAFHARLLEMKKPREKCRDVHKLKRLPDGSFYEIMS